MIVFQSPKQSLRHWLNMVTLVFFATSACAEYHEAAPITLPKAILGNTLSTSANEESIVLAGGCFWGVQGVFQHLKGVKGAVSGYAGGPKESASYHTVSSGLTGHAESVEVRFDPSQISLTEVLRVYFSVAHDPTQINRQGPDDGSQYRSAIFYKNENQKHIVETYIAQLNQSHLFQKPIATQIGALKAFYPAENYHQDYATLHPEDRYISYYDLPKIANLRKLFPELYLEKPTLVATH
jgi:peptide-methionine (S)-S-oxide reductase